MLIHRHCVTALVAVLCSLTCASWSDGREVDIAGVVVDEAGAFLDASVHTIPGSGIRRGKEDAVGHFTMTGKGRFDFLEVMCDGYQARVLLPHKDFDMQDRNLRITLKKGPYQEGQSVFASVTGRPANENWYRFVGAETVRKRERYYRESAAAGNLPPWQQAPLRKSWGIPGLSRPPELPSPAGKSFIDLYKMPPARSTELPYVRVTNRKGAPIQEVFVRWAPSAPAYEGATDVMEQIPDRRLRNPDGLYTVPNNSMVRAEGFESVFVPAVRESGADPIPIVLSEVWRKERRIGWRVRKRYLSELEDWTPQGPACWRRLKELADTARTLKARKAAPFFRSILLEWKNRKRPWIEEGDFGLFQNLTLTIAELEGDEAVPFFERLAEDASMPYLIQRTGIIGLGLIGSAESAAAYSRLRDKARVRPDAPQEKNAYTHAERICEAVLMTTRFIPGKPKWGGRVGEPVESSVEVSPDYAHATVRCGELCSTPVTLRRFGDEWMVVEFGSTLCV